MHNLILMNRYLKYVKKILICFTWFVVLITYVYTLQTLHFIQAYKANAKAYMDQKIAEQVRKQLAYTIDAKVKQYIDAYIEAEDE